MLIKWLAVRLMIFDFLVLSFCANEMVLCKGIFYEVFFVS